jgi:hypothetical protein
MLAPLALVLQALLPVQPLVLLLLVLLVLVLLVLVPLVLLVLVPLVLLVLVQPLPLLFSLTSLHVWLAAMLRTHPRQPV